MFKAIPIGLFLWLALSLQGQNLLDDEGRKTGHWKVEYPNGKILYEADFLEGQPVGVMVRYHDNGVVKARMIFDPGGKKSQARLFFKSGKPAAEGLYVNQVKDSVWTYYSEYDGSVRIRESYLDGKLEGVTRRYYPSGEISEEVEWKQNVKDGPWKQYYENGAPRLSGTYKNGLLQGLYEVYFSNKAIKIRGTYVENKSHGTWSFYNEKGEEIYSLEYINGVPADMEKYESWIQDTLMKYENVSEPDSFLDR
jgi:antitoxin component YwqK of YwqJK toxin-antitoxin module